MQCCSYAVAEFLVIEVGVMECWSNVLIANSPAIKAQLRLPTAFCQPVRTMFSRAGCQLITKVYIHGEKIN
jgi:hypothetical protein